jgi:hypothetical protein
MILLRYVWQMNFHRLFCEKSNNWQKVLKIISHDRLALFRNGQRPID